MAPIFFTRKKEYISRFGSKFLDDCNLFVIPIIQPKQIVYLLNPNVVYSFSVNGKTVSLRHKSYPY